ncbi:DNA-binding protein [Actinoplanes missouriensis]|uniref:DNA-binding protein n=1 Tax=Actinoplanes missouriensis TaxID=1866 RepID=UPI0033C0880F
MLKGEARNVAEKDQKRRIPFGVHPDAVRAEREEAALERLVERFVGRPSGAGARLSTGPTAFDAIRSTIQSANETEPPVVDEIDLMSALTLLPRVRAELDGLEAALLFLARERGMSWAEIAFGMGLGSPQAAQQRSERTQQRAGDAAGDLTSPPGNRRERNST